MPLWAVLFAGLWGRWPLKLEWLGLALGMAGVVLLNLGTNLSASPLGLLLLLGSPVAWAFGSVWSHHLPLPPKLMNSAAQMLAGGLAFMLLAVLFGERMNEWPGPDALVAFGFLIVFGSLIAYTAYNYLLRQVKPALATSYAYVNPVVAMGLGVGLGGEPSSLVGVLASLVVLTGVVLVTLSRSQS
jgi:drug/metabolite transporter (DMT)-like permease